MKTEEIIDIIKYNELIPKEVCEEIIQRLRELNDLTKVCEELVDAFYKSGFTEIVNLFKDN